MLQLLLIINQQICSVAFYLKTKIVSLGTFPYSQFAQNTNSCKHLPCQIIFDDINLKYIFGERIEIPTYTHIQHNSVIDIFKHAGRGPPPPPLPIPNAHPTHTQVGRVGRKRPISPRVNERGGNC